MRHGSYGNLPHIYYEKHDDRYYVRFKRRGQFFKSPYYKTVEEAIQARNVMQRIVPKPVAKQYGTKKICDYTYPTWKYDLFLKGIEQPINDKQNLNRLPNSKQGVTKYSNRKQQQKLVVDTTK